MNSFSCLNVWTWGVSAGGDGRSVPRPQRTALPLSGEEMLLLRYTSWSYFLPHVSSLFFSAPLPTHLCICMTQLGFQSFFLLRMLGGKLQNMVNGLLPENSNLCFFTFPMEIDWGLTVSKMKYVSVYVTRYARYLDKPTLSTGIKQMLKSTGPTSITEANVLAHPLLEIINSLDK